MAEQFKMNFEPGPELAMVPVAQLLESAITLARSNDPVAQSAFDEVESAATACSDPEMQMRVFEASADFHYARKALGVAEKKYETALDSAKLMAVTSDDGIEDEERLRYKLTKVRNADDLSFKVLEKAAQRSYTYEKLNIAWASFQKDRGNSVGLLAARGLGSEEDFRRRLDAAKWTPNDDEDEEVR